MWSVDEAAAAAATGDRDATHQLLAHVRPLLVAYCRRKIGHHIGVATAEDIAQDVCLALVDALPSWRRERPFTAFLYGVAAHKVVDAIRADARDLARPADDIDELATADSPEQIVLRRERNTQLHALLQALQPRPRAILIMRLVHGMSARETAAAVDTTEGAVRASQHFALTRLRRLAADHASARRTAAAGTS